MHKIILPSLALSSSSQLNGPELMGRMHQPKQLTTGQGPASDSKEASLMGEVA